MRNYGTIQTKFWSHRDIIGMSDQAKLLASYFLSSSHTNMLGCFRIPIGYIAEDLRWDVEVANKALQELIEINFLSYDAATSWVFINNFLKYHPIENPNQGRSIKKLFEELPPNLPFLDQLIKKLSQKTKHLEEDFYERLETLSKPFLNQEQEQEQDKEQKQEDMSGKPDVDSKKNDFSLLKEQAIEVLEFLNQKAGKAYRPVDDNLKLIMARLKSGASVMDCRQVIVKKNREWKSNPKMVEYLRPATLFNAEKFEQYMGELVIPEEELEHGAS